MPVPASLHLARIIPGCELRRVEGAGHYWIFEQIEEVLKTLLTKMSENWADTQAGDHVST